MRVENILMNLFERQDKLNELIVNNWKEEDSIITLEGLITITYVELGEFIDTLNWEWWKDKPLNINNIYNLYIEYVDILHFVLSFIQKAIYITYGSENYNDKLLQFIREFKNTYNNICLDNCGNVNIDNIYNEFVVNKDKDDIKKKIVNIFVNSGMNIVLIMKNIYTLIKIFKYQKSGINIIDTLVVLLKQYIKFGNDILKVDLDTIYLIYKGKNILNEFRQKYGYKEGKYIKIWDKDRKLEDNYFLIKYIMDNIRNGNKSISDDNIYKYLEECYNRVVSKLNS